MPEDPSSSQPALEEVLTQLEAAVRRLADQSAPLERLVADWEQARALAVEAERRLDRAERDLPRPEGADRGG
ncbi:MAG: exodeoxyribonuclease VII small subunit [Candidatus Dormibacteraceae bacterium]